MRISKCCATTCIHTRFVPGTLAAQLPADCAWTLRILAHDLLKVFVIYLLNVVRSLKFALEYSCNMKSFVSPQYQDSTSLQFLVILNSPPSLFLIVQVSTYQTGFLNQMRFALVYLHYQGTCALVFTKRDLTCSEIWIQTVS